MNTAEVRALLEHTGTLYTNSTADPGYVSDLWRKTILRLCGLLETTPVDAAELLQAERTAHSATRSALAAETEDTVSLEWQAIQLKRLLAEQRGIATRLIEEAIPRMRTLNNAMSPGWLARADEFLEGR